MSSEYIIAKEMEQMVIRVKDMYDLNTLNVALDEGWRIVNTCIMPFVVVDESSKYMSPTTKTVGGYIDYILEKEVDDEESTTVPSSE